jgi:hypothetical protein
MLDEIKPYSTQRPNLQSVAVQITQRRAWLPDNLIQLHLLQ